MEDKPKRLLFRFTEEQRELICAWLRGDLEGAPCSDEEIVTFRELDKLFEIED